MSGMRRALVLMGLLAGLAGAIMLKTRRMGDGTAAKFSIDRAAELAPGEATFFLAVPDVDRTVARWKGNEVYPFSRGAEGTVWNWRELIGLMNQERDIDDADFDGFDARLEWVGDWESYQAETLAPYLALLGEVDKLEPAALWIAAAGLRERSPRIVVGLRYHGKKTEVEGAVRRLKERLFAKWPGAKSELSREHGIEVETITGVVAEAEHPPLPVEVEPPLPAPTAQIAFRDDWVFLATDRAMLAGTLGRYVGAADAGKGLAADPWFAQCRWYALAEADFCLWTEFREKRENEKWSERSLSEEFWDNELKAAHYECRVDGATSGRLYLQLGESGRTRSEPAPVAPVIQNIYCFGPFVLTAEEDVWEALGNLRREPALALAGPSALPGCNWSMDGLGAEFPGQRRRAIVAELSERFGSDLTFVMLERGKRGLPSYVAGLELDGDAEAFRFAVRIGDAKREALLRKQRVMLDSGAQEEWETLSAPVKADSLLGPGLRLGQDAPVRASEDEGFVVSPVKPVPADLDWIKRRREQGLNLQVEANGGDAPSGARYYVEMPGVIESGRVELPALSLRYEPWLMPRRFAGNASGESLPTTIRVRKDGKNWVIDSDLNVLGRSLIDEMMLHQLGPR